MYCMDKLLGPLYSLLLLFVLQNMSCYIRFGWLDSIFCQCSSVDLLLLLLLVVHQRLLVILCVIGFFLQPVKAVLATEHIKTAVQRLVIIILHFTLYPFVIIICVFKAFLSMLCSPFLWAFLLLRCIGFS